MPHGAVPRLRLGHLLRGGKGAARPHSTCHRTRAVVTGGASEPCFLHDRRWHATDRIDQRNSAEPRMILVLEMAERAQAVVHQIVKAMASTAR